MPYLRGIPSTTEATHAQRFFQADGAGNITQAKLLADQAWAHVMHGDAGWQDVWNQMMYSVQNLTGQERALELNAKAQLKTYMLAKTASVAAPAAAPLTTTVQPPVLPAQPGGTGQGVPLPPPPPQVTITSPTNPSPPVVSPSSPVINPAPGDVVAAGTSSGSPGTSLAVVAPPATPVVTGGGVSTTALIVGLGLVGALLLLPSKKGRRRRGSRKLW